MFGFDELMSVADLGAGIWANEKNRSMANKQMRFQERMSNTSHQREIEDLRKAGLNPILSAGGGGASTPAGSMATMQNSASSAARNYYQSQLLKEQLKNIETDTYLKDSQINLNNEASQTQKFQQRNIAEDTKLKFEMINKAVEEIEIAKNTVRSGAMDNTLKQMDVDMFTNAEILKNAKTLGVTPDTFRGLLKLIFGDKK